jgi:hypothetical protein
MDSCRDLAILYLTIFSYITANTVANRPDHIKSRALNRYHLLNPMLHKKFLEIFVFLQKNDIISDSI